MNIIMLSGKASCGKTTTLNLVYKHINPAAGDIITSTRTLKHPDDKDFECIIRYRNKTVAIYSEGDFSCGVCDAFINFDGKCDVLVCACNTRFVRPYQQIEKYLHIVIDKTMPLSNASNITDRDKILALI